LADWTVATIGPTHVVARIRSGHLASEAVAASAGFGRRGRLDDHHDLWARITPGRDRDGGTVPS
jgi:RimJ/RimL family protein N-acetyltransferase